jgi:hypothetical protein
MTSTLLLLDERSISTRNAVYYAATPAKYKVTPHYILCSYFRPDRLIKKHQTQPIEQKHRIYSKNNQRIKTLMARFTSLFLVGLGFLLHTVTALPNQRRDSSKDHFGTLGKYNFETMDAPESLLKGTHDGLFTQDQMKKYMSESGMEIRWPDYERYTPDMLPDFQCASADKSPKLDYFHDVESQLVPDGVKDSWCCSLYSPCTRLATGDDSMAASDICAVDKNNWKPTCLPCRLLQLALFQLESCALNSPTQVAGGTTTYVKLILSIGM